MGAWSRLRSSLIGTVLRRRARPPPRQPETGRHEEVRALWEATAALGPSRQQVIACLCGDIARNPEHRFSPADGSDLFDAFRRFVLRTEARATVPSGDRLGPSLLAAGRLLSGDVSGADRIIALLPVRRYVLDHGAGRCLVLPSRILRRALPLPSDAGDPDTWLDGSPAQAMLRAWMERHRPRLRWLEAEGEYRLGG